MSIWRWAEWLDPIPAAARITLGEGTTPLVRSRRIGPAAGLKNLFLKLDFATPTGSYKDRFAAAAVSHMVAAGQTRCVATSSGNTGASLAAYCAAAGIECRIAIVEGAPEGKLQQMLAYGAKLARIRGFGTDPDITARTMQAVQRLGSQPGSAVQVSAFHFSPLGMAGVKTISHELAEQHTGIDRVFVPAGGGGLAVAVAKGFEDVVRAGWLTKSPRIEVVQPLGNDTIAGPLRDGAEGAREVSCTSRISGLQVPNVIDGDLAIRLCRASGGTGHRVADEDVWAVQTRLALEEGIFCEPAAATALTGALNAARDGDLPADAVVVCLVTGSGFKDPPSVQRMLERAACPLLTLDEFASLN